MLHRTSALAGVAALALLAACDAGAVTIGLMAPNYQAGKDMLAGLKRFYNKGEVIGDTYTQVNQPDYSAELAQLQAAKPEAAFVFYPGGMGVNFVKQMGQAGLLGKVPLYSVFTVDGTTLPSLRDSAAGSIGGAMWDAALDAPENRKLVVKQIGTPLSAHADTYHTQCALRQP